MRWKKSGYQVMLVLGDLRSPGWLNWKGRWSPPGCGGRARSCRDSATAAPPLPPLSRARPRHVAVGGTGLVTWHSSGRARRSRAGSGDRSPRSR